MYVCMYVSSGFSIGTVSLRAAMYWLLNYLSIYLSIYLSNKRLTSVLKMLQSTISGSILKIAAE